MGRGNLGVWDQYAHITVYKLGGQQKIYCIVHRTILNILQWSIMGKSLKEYIVSQRVMSNSLGPQGL